MLFDDYLSAERWRDVRRLTDGPSDFALEWFEPGEKVRNVLFFYNSNRKFRITEKIKKIVH